MDANLWFEEKSAGFRELGEPERNAILLFVLIWSFFEFKVLKSKGSAKSIRDKVRQWEDNSLLTDKLFDQELTYFRGRYFAGGAFTEHFDGLKFKMNDQPELVKRVLKNESASLAEKSVTTLMIVYRFRNNFFHGEKWAYEIREQLENFSHANAVLIQAIELHESSTLMS